MKIISKETYIDINEKKVKVMMSFEEELDNLIQGRREYNQMGILDEVRYNVTNKITERMILEYSDEIIKKIDIDALVKRVQMQIIDRLGRA